jgi:hypothetical protein
MMDAVVVEGWSGCRAVLLCPLRSAGNVALIFEREAF